VVEPIHLKNMRTVKLDHETPNFRGEKSKYLSCHHLVVGFFCEPDRCLRFSPSPSSIKNYTFAEAENMSQQLGSLVELTSEKTLQSARGKIREKLHARSNLKNSPRKKKHPKNLKKTDPPNLFSGIWRTLIF